MAIIVRNTGGDPLALAAAIAQNLEAQSTTNVSTFFHADSTSNPNQLADAAFGVPSTPSGQFVTQSISVDLLSAQQLANTLAGALIGSGQTSEPPAHFYDAPANSIVKCGAHKLQDSVNTALVGARAAFIAAGGVGGANQTDTNTFVNAIKTYFNAHLTQSGVHYSNDTTNTEATANASNLATCMALVNSMRNKLNNHIAHSNTAYPQIRVIDP